MSTQAPDYRSLLRAYHRAREPLYRQIIADAHLAPTALILDAGCGDCFYSRLIADALGPDVRIIGVDRSPIALRFQFNSDRAIQLCQSNLERAGLRSGAFDAIWLCRTMHSAPDPPGRLAALVPLLRPGGKLIVVENDLAHYPIFSWPADFEHRLQLARYQYLKSRCNDGASLERYYSGRHLPTWLAQAGLQQIAIHTYVSEDVAPMSDTVETYWRLFMAWQGDRMGQFLSDEDRQAYARASDPESSDYLLRCPGFYCLELTTVASGTAPS